MPFIMPAIPPMAVPIALNKFFTSPPQSILIRNSTSEYPTFCQSILAAVSITVFSVVVNDLLNPAASCPQSVSNSALFMPLAILSTGCPQSVSETIFSRVVESPLTNVAIDDVTVEKLNVSKNPLIPSAIAFQPPQS